MRGLGGWARRVQLIGLYVLLALLPFSKAAVEICFGLLFIGWIVERLTPATRAQTVWRSPALRPVLIGLVSYLAVCALSIVVSDHPGKSLRGFVSKWVEYLLFVVIVADVAARPGVARRSLAIVAWSSLAVVGQALAQELVLLPLRSASIPYPTRPFGAYDRMTGPYENPIDLATYLMVAIPVLLGVWGAGRVRTRWLIGLLLLILIGCLARTQALGAWAGLTAGLLLFLWSQRAVRRVVILWIGAVALAALTALSFTGRLRLLSWLDQGAADRWLMWQAAIGMIRDRLLLGHGVNTFMANYLTYRVGGEAFPRYAHNCYLQVAAETGVIGLAAFLWLLLCLARRLLAGLREIQGDRRWLLLGLSAGLLAFALQAGVDTNFYALRQAALFWVLSGLALGLTQAQPEPAP